MAYSEVDYRAHLENEHKQTAFEMYLKEIVYGGTDGIITTFAVVAGFSGAGSTSIPLVSVVLFGLANLFADGVSMGLGNFLSIRSNQDLYKTEREKEEREIRVDQPIEQKETEDILAGRGFTRAQAKALTDIYMTNPKFWTEFMLNSEHGIENPQEQNPLFTALATFISFVIFGSIPLIPYFFNRNGAQQLFSLSILFTATALAALGFLRFRITKVSLLRSMAEVVILGGSAATIAYFVGTFFRS